MRKIVAAWIFCEEELLLIHHRKSGQWLPVGGHVEKGEGLLEALAREVREETGLAITASNQPFRIWARQGEQVHDFTATATTEEVRLQESEIMGAKWLERDALEEAEEVSARVKAVARDAFKMMGRASSAASQEQRF